MAAHRFVVDALSAGKTLAAALRSELAGTSWGKAKGLCSSGRVRVGAVVAQDPGLRLAAGDVVEVDPTAPRKRGGILADEAILYEDRDVVVVRKPAGLLTVPFEPTDRDTLVDITGAALRRRAHRHARVPSLGIVHRLDKDTTGLVVFARNIEAKRALDKQFRHHSILRRYLAIVHGRATDATFETLIMRDRGDGLRGSWGHFRAPHGKPPMDARRAVTHVQVIELLRGATYVGCRLQTGRQHQIRVHLSEAGHPLVGEKVYIRDYEGEQIEAPRPMLHAAELGFDHPRTSKPLRFEQPPPPDFIEMLARLRLGPRPS